MPQAPSQSILRSILVSVVLGVTSCVLVQPVKAAVAFGASGLNARYFDGYWNGDLNFFNLNTPAFTRTDQQVNFSDGVYNSGSTNPLNSWDFAGTALSDEETFSAEWTGQLMVDTAGTYDFQTFSDDGIQLFINNTLVVSNPSIHGPTYNTGTIALAAGSYPLKLVYGENFVISVAQLAWKEAGASSFSVVKPVPGPLPVMGVGAALMFSRKVRARMAGVSRSPRQA